MSRRNRRKEDTTHIICILDRSTSMWGLRESVISNFNKFLKEQQDIEGKAALTLVLFDTEIQTLYDRVPLEQINPLTSNQYFTQGMTAMYDAIGQTLHEMRNEKKAIVLIHTDGEENSSTEYNESSVKEQVKGLKKNWEFIYAAGGIDAKETGTRYGFTNNFQTVNNVAGIADTYATFTCSTAAYRSGNDVKLVDVIGNDIDVEGNFKGKLNLNK